MHKTFIATALALGMCLPVYAEQFSNSNSDSMLSPTSVEEPNVAVPHREKLDTEKINVLIDEARESIQMLNFNSCSETDEEL